LKNKYALALVELTPQQYDKLLKLRREGKIIKIFPNRKVKAFLQDTTRLLNATDVWTKLNITGKGSLVCVLDTGVDYTHPDLNRSVDLALSWDYVNWDSNPMDDNGHGTHVAGTIAGNNSPYIGVAPGASIVAIKACDSNGDCTLDDQLDALDWCYYHAAEYNITVVSMSIGGSEEFNDFCNKGQNVDARFSSLALYLCDLHGFRMALNLKN